MISLICKYNVHRDKWRHCQYEECECECHEADPVEAEIEEPVELVIVPKNEKEFLEMIRDEATLTGWDLIYHTRNSRCSDKGFPDLVLVRPPRLLFTELKMKGNKPTPEQELWLEKLQQIPGIEAYLWYCPDDMDPIKEILA